MKIPEKSFLTRVHSTFADVGERSEAVDLQFVHKLVGVEKLGTARKPHGTHLAWQHGRSITGTIVGMLSPCIANCQGLLSNLVITNA